MEAFEHKEPKEQIEIFKSRNMIFQDEAKAEITLVKVPYYKIKEFARPYCKINKEKDVKIDYQQTKFEHVLSRYYQDKNLRIQLLHLLEEIEVALKTLTAYTLSKDGNGGYAYLKFDKWCDKNEYCKHYLKLKEYELKKDIKKALSSRRDSEINEKKKIDKNEFPPVWLGVVLLTFGQLVNLIQLMSTRHKNYISDKFNCSNKELISWLKCINYIRNICAHNSNFIDIKLKTRPHIKDEWKSNLHKVRANSKELYSDRIALPIMIMNHMIKAINQKYQMKLIKGSLDKLIRNDTNAISYGFASLQNYKNCI